MGANLAAVLSGLNVNTLKSGLPDFRAGDTVKVHVKIVEGNKERIQIFEGVVICRHKGNDNPSASFTVRKVSYNVGVERTFLLHSPRIDKIELVGRGQVRRARLYYLRPLRGKATRLKTKYEGAGGQAAEEQPELVSPETATSSAE